MPTFPLIRAGSLVPFVRWAQGSRVPVEVARCLDDLMVDPWEEPDRPVALHSALAVLRAIERSEGPDIGCRVVSEVSIADLAALGRVILDTATPREALFRASAVMPRHSTHEHISVEPVSGGIALREQMTINVDPATLHVEQQYVAAMVRALCLATGYGGEPLRRVELQPHPTAGIGHLHGHLGPGVAAASAQALYIFIADEVLDRPFPPRLREPAAPAGEWRVLRGDGTFSGTARLFVEAMLENGAPSIGRLCAAGGLSQRTLQRRLGDEGTSYSALLDETRRALALKALAGSSLTVGHISADLGYSTQPAFNRAVRRWTATAPLQVRRAAKPAGAGGSAATFASGEKMPI